MSLEVPDRLRQMPIPRVRDLLCKANPGIWAEMKRGFQNSPVHWEWYQLMVDKSRLCVIAPREHAKSECFTVNGTAWRSIYRPGTWSYVFAATGDQAEKIKERVDQAILEVEPHLVIDARSMNNKESVYANYSMITVAGAGKAVRGAHPDVIVGDDVLEEQSCLTSYQRKKTESWWKGTVGGMAHPGTTRLLGRLGKVRMPPTRVILVGTPFHEQDLLMNMRKNELYSFRRYSAEYRPEQLVPGSLAVEAR